MPLKHLTSSQWDTVDAGTPDQKTRDHLAICEECRAVVAESRALLVGLRRSGHTQVLGQPLATDHPAAEDLAAYAEGVLFDAGARSIEEHLERCSDCRDDIIVVRDMAAVGDLKETVSLEIRDQLLERLSRARQPDPVTSLGAWLVKANRKLGAVFSETASAMTSAPDLKVAFSQRAVSHSRDSHVERSVLEDRLRHARHEVEEARSMMEDATGKLRYASRRVEQILEEVAGLAHRFATIQEEAVAASAKELEQYRRGPTPVGAVLDLAAADVRLRIESRDRARPNVFTVTVTTRNDRPATGVALEVRSPDGEPTLRTTDERGQALFSLERGESTLRLMRHGVWELRLARLS